MRPEAHRLQLTCRKPFPLTPEEIKMLCNVILIPDILTEINTLLYCIRNRYNAFTPIPLYQRKHVEILLSDIDYYHNQTVIGYY